MLRKAFEDELDDVETAFMQERHLPLNPTPTPTPTPKPYPYPYPYPCP